MSMVDDILSSAQGGKLIENLAQSFGLTPEQIRSAITALAPALALGLRNAASNPEDRKLARSEWIMPTSTDTA